MRTIRALAATEFLGIPAMAFTVTSKATSSSDPFHTLEFSELGSSVTESA